MKKTKAVVLLMRLPFLTVTLGGVALGTGFARWETGAWDPLIAALAFLGAAFIHAATNVVNDYYDYKAGTDAANRSGTSPFSGGSGMVLGATSSRAWPWPSPSSWPGRGRASDSI